MAALSPIGAFVRRHDPDRFFTSLFAPQARREALWALYAFNHELVRAGEAAREPMMAMIRLQWWREIVEGADRRHEVAEPLRHAIATGALATDGLLAMIDAREQEPPDGPQAWRDHVEQTAGTLAAVAGRTLGAHETDAIRAAGSAYGAAGLLRNRHLGGREPIAGLADAGRDWLQAARTAPIPNPAFAAALPAVFAARDLRRSEPLLARGLADKAAVVMAAARGRI